MYSTLKGAKQCAKTLKRVFDDSALIYPLHKCQAAVARAGGYADWRGMETALCGDPRPQEPSAFRRRLLGALPAPCLAPVRAWLDDEPAPDEPIEGVPLRWYRDTHPYMRAVRSLYVREPLLRPGSGVGQKLREQIMFDLLLNLQGGSRPMPWLEPNTMTFVFPGDLPFLFRKTQQHARFQQELQTLIDAGFLDWRGDEMRLLPPPGSNLEEEVRRDRAEMAQHWAQDGGHGPELINALREALSAIGVDKALRVAEAIALQDSSAYSTPSGAVLELLSELAAAGQIETFAHAVNLFATVRPANAAFVKASVPAKISDRYWVGKLGLRPGALLAWSAKNPHWSETLKISAADPADFIRNVEAFATAVQEDVQSMR